jgi:nitronate monooxygenase
MLCTPLCRTLGISHPILSAGIGSAAGPELAAAVSNAGGLGVLGTASLPARFVRLQINRLRELSDRPFGVNVVLPLLRRGTIEACLDEHAPVLILFWGEAGEVRSIIADAHRQNTGVFVQVGSRDEALVAVEAGADGVIAQGWEAGGHVRGTTALSVLVPTVVDAIAPVPVIAAGGVADGRTLLAALCLGAQAVSMGTRFLASEEANADPGYKQRVVSAIAEDTVRTELFDRGWERASHRVLRNELVRAWETLASEPWRSPTRRGDSRDDVERRYDGLDSSLLGLRARARRERKPRQHGALRWSILLAGQRHQAGSADCGRGDARRRSHAPPPASRRCLSAMPAGKLIP